jgi:hypothetical protein
MTLPGEWTISMPLVAVRVAVVVVALGLWFWTQRLLGKRTPIDGGNPGVVLGDGVHWLTRRVHAYLLSKPGAANALLVSSSLVIDLLGGYLIATALFGPTVRPFLGLIMVFALRQACQALCPLPSPPNMIWRTPGFPSLLVTYGTSNDLFFSGHTALAVFGAATLADTFGPLGMALGVAIVAFEIGAVLVLRAHYTLDVFAGAVTALYVHRVAMQWSPTVDGWLASVAGMWS